MVPPPIPQSPPIRQQVLSIFHDHRKRTQIPPDILPHPKKPRTSSHALVNPSTRALVTQLVCLSAAQGKNRLQLIDDSVRNRACSSSELSALIFEIDDAEFMPPLCVIVSLLRSELLRHKHVNQQLILQRVEYEMNSPEICLCRGAAKGINSLLNYAADVSHEQHGFLLQSLVSAIFPRTIQSLGAMHLRSRLLVAEKTILFVHKYVKSDGEGYHLLLEWANQATLPTTYSQEPMSDAANPVVWTPELSGLATGRSCSEYLPEGELHESVLRKLFVAIQPSDASDIYLACLNSLHEGSRIKNNYINGTWARVVLLGQRIGDKKSVEDVSEDIVKKTVSSISGALGALSPTSDPYLSAVLICLTRRLLIPSPSFPDGKQRSEVYQQYKEWFRQFIAQHERKTVEGLLPALIQLLPLEPLELLRLNHRVFSGRRELARVVSAYLVIARSRISELDPVPRNFLSEEEAAAAAQINEDIKNSPKLVLTVAHYIKDFARAKELPRALLRQINFHRYHFQRTTRVALLDPSLAQYVAETGDPHFIVGRDKFESHQINLITHLAFKRKDRAIPASEANTAIKAIKEAKNARLCPTEPGQILQSARQWIVDDSLQDIINGALEAGTRLERGKENETNERSPIRTLRVKLKKVLSAASQADLAKIASDVLHGLFAAISKRVPELTNSKSAEDQKPRILCDYEEWWVSTGKALRGILLEVFGDPNIQILQKPLQYQLFALICTATDSLYSAIMCSAAMLTITILTLHTESSLTDLCFAGSNACSKLSPLLNLVVECLPFSSMTRVRNSVTFIMCCVLLLHSASETVLDVFVESHDDIEVLETQRTRQAFQAICKEKLSSLFVFLQWVLCFPWRLVEDRRLSKREPPGCSSLIQQASKVLVFFGHEDLQDQEVIRILAVEMRCGWGREDAIHSFIERLESAGKCSKSLLREAIHFLATKNRDTACSRGWIQNALVRFARDRTWCERNVNGHSSVDVSDVEYLCREVDGCGAYAGRDVFDLLLLTDQCFFHGLSVSEAVRCIMLDLMPRFWPFSRRYIIFMVYKLKANCIRERNLDYGIADLHLLTANMIAELINDDIDGALDGLVSGLSKGLLDVSVVQEILEVTNVMQAVDRGDEDNVTEQAKKHSPCLGSALILSLCRSGESRKQEQCRDLLTHRVSLMCRILPSLLACEVLDWALSTAAVIPFCVRFCKIRDRRLKMKETTEWMKVLTLERLALSDSRYTVPIHTREELRGNEAKKEPLIQTCLQWLGRSNRSFEEDPLGNSLPIAICMGRVFGALYTIDKQALKSFLERVGARMSRTLVSNTLHTYESLAPNVSFSSEKLPRECMQKLEEVRLDVQRDLLYAIAAILRTMREIAENDFEESFTNMLRPYQGIEDEVRSAMNIGCAMAVTQVSPT